MKREEKEKIWKGKIFSKFIRYCYIEFIKKTLIYIQYQAFCTSYSSKIMVNLCQLPNSFYRVWDTGMFSKKGVLKNRGIIYKEEG